VRRNRDKVIAEKVMTELAHARFKFGQFASAHEGYAVLLEEVHELWDEVRKGGTKPRSRERMRAEAIQVAAMAIRFASDVCGEVEP